MSFDSQSFSVEPAEIAQLLDEHHLVVPGGDAALRADFAQSLAELLRAMPDCEVVDLPGARIESVADFGRELATGLPGRRASGASALEDVIDLLRATPPSLKRQYFIWSDADVLLEANEGAFGLLANALLGVAAEHEHITPDVLVLQRVVFLGDDRLDDYAGEENGQFRTWLLENGTSRFWEVVSCVPQPSVMTFRLD